MTNPEIQDLLDKLRQSLADKITKGDESTCLTEDELALIKSKPILLQILEAKDKYK